MYGMLDGFKRFLNEFIVTILVFLQKIIGSQIETPSHLEKEIKLYFP